MTENIEGQEPADSTLTDDGIERDPELQMLANVVDSSSSMEIGITVVTGGTVISGRLVGPERWHEVLHELGASASGNRAEQMLSGLRDAYRREEDAPRELLAYGYLHLINSHILTSSGMTGGQFMWRIRISEVSAWTFQQWTADPG